MHLLPFGWGPTFGAHSHSVTRFEISWTENIAKHRRSGHIGGTLARRFSKLGHKVFIANSCGPTSLTDLVAETGATAASVHEAARNGEIVIVAIPQWKIADLPKDIFEEVSQNVAVVDKPGTYGLAF